MRGADEGSRLDFVSVGLELLKWWVYSFFPFTDMIDLGLLWHSDDSNDLVWSEGGDLCGYGWLGYGWVWLALYFWITCWTWNWRGFGLALFFILFCVVFFNVRYSAWKVNTLGVPWRCCGFRSGTRIILLWSLLGFLLSVFSKGPTGCLEIGNRLLCVDRWQDEKYRFWGTAREEME